MVLIFNEILTLHPRVWNDFLISLRKPTQAYRAILLAVDSALESSILHKVSYSSKTLN